MSDYLSMLDTHSCIILHDSKIIFVSNESGVKPLLDFYHSNKSFYEDLTVVDRIMGRGAIILAKLIHANQIITPIISEDALELAGKYQMNVEYTQIVPYIINRTQTGRCPIETSVLGISDELQGYTIIIETLKSLAKNQ